jgi:hypothetical protein
MKTADPVARHFMQLVSDGKDADAYAMADAKMKAMSPLADFKRFASMWRAGQGKLQNAALAGNWWYSGTGGTRITLAYNVQGSKGSGRVMFVLVPEGNGLRVQTCNFNPGGAQ